MKTETTPKGTSAETQTAQSADRCFGLRREVKRHAAFGSHARFRKAVSPLRSATAIQTFAPWLLLARLGVAMAVCIFALIPSGLAATTNDLSGLLQKGLFEEEANRNLDAAAQAYQSVSRQFDKDRALAATAIFRLGEIYRKQNKTNEAAAQYERILREFEDQGTLVTLSRQNLTGLGMAAKTAVGQAPVATRSAEAQELERSEKILAQLSDWDVSQLRKMIPTVLPDAEFERVNEQLRMNEVFGKNGDLQILLQRNAYRDQLQKRANEIMVMLERRVKLLREVVAKQNAIGSTTVVENKSPVTTIPDEEEAEIRRIQAMIQNSPDLINARREGANGDLTPLGQAAGKGQLRVAEYLLSNGADVDTTVNGSTPLSIAARNGHKKMVELLLARGAAVNAVDGERRTPLHVAVTYNYPAVVESLLAAKADPNAKDSGDNTPLMVAVQQGSRPMAKALLARGADVNLVNKVPAGRGFPNVFSERSNYGSALHLAAARGNVALTQLLLTNRADVTLRSIFGETALHVAAVNGRTEVAALLIAAGADVNAAGSGEQTGGATPLHLATAGGHREMAKLLLEHGANPNVRAVIGQHGVTPLMLAANQKDVELVELLLEHKADPNLVNAGGNTALLNAVMQRSPETVRALLAGGANPETKNAGVYPVLIIAVTGTANKDVVTALIAAKANVNAPDPNGKTPLHWAAESKRTDLVELLVNAGADVNLRDKSGKTALDYAKQGTTAGGALTVSPPRPGVPLPLSVASLQMAAPGSATATDATPADVAALLREHGALDELPDFTRIEAGRAASGYRATAFTRATNDWSHYTLLDLLAQQWGLLSTKPEGVWQRAQKFRNNLWSNSPLRWPDLEHITIHRPAKGGKTNTTILVNLGHAVTNDLKAADVPLQFGDTVDIPEADHPVSESWSGLPAAELEALIKAVSRQVTIVVNGKAVAMPLSPSFTTAGPVLTYQQYNLTTASFMLRAVLDESKLVRSSSDLTRVKVVRKAGADGKTQQWIVDCSGAAGPYPELWLQDGDVIEVPDKP